jgi:hypothetical protein
MHLRIAQQIGSSETRYELSALPLGSGPQERFDDAWQAAPNCAYMEEASTGHLGAVVTLDMHFHILHPFHAGQLRAATHILDR